MTRPLLLSWSGGKDAAWTLHTLRQRAAAGEAEVAVVGLVTTLTDGYDRIAMQGIRRALLQAQAEACGLPVIEAWMPQRASNEIYRATFADALVRAQARWPGLRDIAFGDLFLADIRAYREALCGDLGWTPHFPIFDAAPGHTARVAQAMLDAGLRASLTCVDTTQLDGDFNGRDFDAALLCALPPTCDAACEHSEFHTRVQSGTRFAAPINVVRDGCVLREDRFAYTDFLHASPPL